MRNLGAAAFGWLLPGGAYLLQRRYLQFAGFAALVSATFAAGILLQGGSQWPQAVDLRGLDGFTSLFFQAGALTRTLAGGPFLLAQLLGLTHPFLDSRIHEYGTTLLVLAGVLNVLAISDALASREAAK